VLAIVIALEFASVFS